MKMRTTIDVDEDVLAAAKELARKQRVSIGKIVSGLLREAMCGGYSRAAARHDEPAGAGGFRPFPARGRVVTDDLIEHISDMEGV
jgi:hypothetical protein